MANSRSLDLAGTVKNQVVDAIDNMCRSIAIDSYEWQMLAEELATLQKLAARTGVNQADLHYVSEPGLPPEVAVYFSDDRLKRVQAADFNNLAGEELQEGKRGLAAKYFEKAMAAAPEDDASDRAFKAVIAYQFGVCLLRTHELEGTLTSARDARLGDDRVHTAVHKIRGLWSYVLDVHASVRREEVGGNLATFLESAAQNVKHDPIMSLRL